jgi:hypothetical protein
MIAAVDFCEVDFCKKEINMRTFLAVVAIGLTSVGYLLGPAAALPRDCFDENLRCDNQLTLLGYSRGVIQSVCGRAMERCTADNRRNGYKDEDALGPPLSPQASKDDDKKKKPKDDWKRHVIPHVAAPSKSGSIGSNAQLGIKATTPTTATTTGSASPALEIKANPPKPATVSNEAIAKRVGAGRL